MGASQHENKGAQMTPSQSKLEQRVSNLETEMEQLKRQLDQLGGGKQPWWEQIIGTFEDDPIYDEAMKRGREYRESLVNIRLTHANSCNSLIYKDSFKVKIYLTRASH
jgi:hypothetical protein